MTRRSLVSPIVLVLTLAGCGGGGPAPDTAAPTAAAGQDASPAPPAARGERSREPADVVGVTWEWVETITPVERIEAPDPSRYTVRLEDDGTVAALFDCNRGTGSYEIAEGRVSFGPLAATRMACPEGSLDARFMKDLGEVTSFFVEGGRLYMELPVDSGTLEFRPAADAAAAG